MNEILHAIADPTRRKIIHLVSRQALNLNSIADNFDISRPAISKHVKILSDCGLILIRQDGRDRFCEARLEKLDAVARWIGQYRVMWDRRMDALELHLSANKHHSKKHKKN